MIERKVLGRKVIVDALDGCDIRNMAIVSLKIEEGRIVERPTLSDYRQETPGVEWYGGDIRVNQLPDGSWRIEICGK